MPDKGLRNNSVKKPFPHAATMVQTSLYLNTNSIRICHYCSPAIPLYTLIEHASHVPSKATYLSYHYILPDTIYMFSTKQPHTPMGPPAGIASRPFG